MKENNKSINRQKLISLSVSIFFILVIIIITALLIHYKPTIEKSQSNDQNLLSPTYFNTVNQWQDTQEQNKLVPRSNYKGLNFNFENVPQETNVSTEDQIDFGKCILYTYDNNFGVHGKPNLDTVLDDYLAGLVQYEIIDDVKDFCVDKDQIVAKQGVHTCDKNDCISVFGNEIETGEKEIFSIACPENNKICEDLLTSISFNFSLNPELNNISSETVSLSVERINLPESKYEKISSFYKNAGLFHKEDSENGNYSAVFTFRKTNPLDYRQKFRVERYSWSTDQSKDPQFIKKNVIGFFAKIIFRIGNLKLSYDVDNNKLCFRDNDDQDPDWLLIPPLDLSANKITTKQRYEMSSVFSMKSKIFQKLITDNSDYPNKDFPFLIKPFPPAIKGSRIFFTELLEPSQGLEVIDTTDTIVKGVKHDFVLPDSSEDIEGGRNFDLSSPDGEKENIVFSYHNSFNFVDNTDNGFYYDAETNKPSGLKESYKQSTWQNTDEISDHVYNPSFTGNGKISYRYKMISPGKVNKDITFHSKLSSGFIYWLKEKSGLAGINYGMIYAGISSNTNSQEIYESSLEIFKVGTNTVIKDGEALWQRLSLYDGIFTFNNSYFLVDNSNNTGLINSTKNSQSSDSSITYIAPKQGMLTFIDFTSSDIETMPEGQLLPYYTISCSDIEELGGTGKFIINLQVNPEGNKVSVKTFDILDQGTGSNKNIKGSSFTVPGTNMVVKNVNFEVDDENIIYTAVPTSNSSGAIFDVTLDGNNLVINSIINGGSGYKQDDVVRIVQVDSSNTIKTTGLGTVNVLSDFLNDNTELSKLASVTVDKISTLPIAPHSLMKSNNPDTDTQKYFDNYEFFNREYEISGQNFKNLYGKSPPQIAFLKKDDNLLMNVAKKFLLNSTNPEDFNKIFESGKSPTGKDTSIEFIETLQLKSLNYQLSDQGLIDTNTFVNPFSSSISNNEELILGRFIPYSYLLTLKEDGTVQDKVLYNSNRTQFIPYGLKHVYSTTINQGDLPSF